MKMVYYTITWYGYILFVIYQFKCIKRFCHFFQFYLKKKKQFFSTVPEKTGFFHKKPNPVFNTYFLVSNIKISCGWGVIFIQFVPNSYKLITLLLSFFFGSFFGSLLGTPTIQQYNWLQKYKGKLSGWHLAKFPQYPQLGIMGMSQNLSNYSEMFTLHMTICQYHIPSN